MRDKFPLINRRNIHASRYTQSLIAEALRVGLMQIELVDDIQMQIRGILEDRLRELRRDSGKLMQLYEQQIRTEKRFSDEQEKSSAGAAECQAALDETCAKMLLDSIFYSLDTYLLGFHDPMYAINAIEAMCVEDMYREGQRALKSLVCETVGLSVKVKKSRMETDNLAYNQMLDAEIRSYLDHYDYRWGGHMIPGSLSYPLTDPLGSMHGIHFLRDYLTRLYAENRFAALFEPEEKALLLSSYAKLHRTTTEGMHANLFSVIINNALGASILGKYTGILTLTEEEVGTLNGMLYRKTTRELEHMTAEAMRAMITDLKPTPTVTAYVNGHARQLVTRLINARNAGDDAKLFVPSDPKELFKI